MAIDANSLCPGGTGKKIKFCCKDLVNDLEKIDKMVEGRQYHACLQLLDRLLERRPDRPCLLALKCLAHYRAEQPEEAAAAARRFAERHPDNPAALTEMAIVTAGSGGAREAVDTVMRALEVAPVVSRRLYGALGLVAQRCLVAGQYVAARALFMLQHALHPEDASPVRWAAQLASMDRFPLVVKNDLRLVPCPEDAPWKADFDHALSLASSGRWRQAAEQFSRLAQRVPDAPAVWRNLGLCRAWLVDPDGAVEAFGRYATLDVPLEDAVEAMALARLHMRDPLGDGYEVLRLCYRVDDVDHLETAMASSRQMARIHGDLSRLAEDGQPPPKAAYWLLDRDKVISPDDLTVENVPEVICLAFLFGRQTDREARLELHDVGANRLDQVKRFFAALAGSALADEAETEVVGWESTTERMLSQNWQLPRGIRPEQLRQLSQQGLERTVLETWPTMPLGLLDGKTPQEAARLEAYRLRVLTAILILQSWLESSPTRFDFNRLRSRLGLPTLNPIDPNTTPVDRLPLVRLARVEVGKLGPNMLRSAFTRSVIFRAGEAAEKLAREIIRRPTMENHPEYRYALALLARSTADSEEALELIRRGRQAAQARQQSCAEWDMMELEERYHRGEPNEMSQLLEHIQRSHFGEPEVRENLGVLLARLGLLRPDGSVQIPVPNEQAAAQQPGSVSGQPGTIWTPDSERPPGQKGKLWTPDSG